MRVACLQMRSGVSLQENLASLAYVRETFGHSLIINPGGGGIIGELQHDDSDILICDIELNGVEIARSRIPQLVQWGSILYNDGFPGVKS